MVVQEKIRPTVAKDEGVRVTGIICGVGCAALRSGNKGIPTLFPATGKDHAKLFYTSTFRAFCGK